MLAVFFLIALPAAVFMIRCLPPEYKVSSSILIRQGKRQVSPDMKPELTVLHSDALAEQVLAAVGAEQLFPQASQGGRVQQFQQRFRVQPVQGADRIVEITFQHPEQQLAVEVVSAVIRLIGLELKKLNEPQASLLEEELLLHRQQMQQAQNVLAMFRQNSRLYSDDWQMQYLEIKRGRLEVVLEEETRQEQELAGELAKLRQQFAAFPVGDAESKEEFLQMKLYRQEIMRKYDAKEPLIASVEEQLKLLRQQIQADKAVERLVDQIAQASAAHAEQQGAKEAVQRELNQIARSLQQQAEQKKVFSSLEAEVEESRTRYAQQLNKVEEIRKAGMKEGYVTVIEQPEPSEPVRPKKLPRLAMAVFFGLIGSLLYGFFRRLPGKNQL